MSDWEQSHEWYDTLVGKEGHYYHKQVILPKLWPLLNLNEKSSLLDMGCGQGVLAGQLPIKIPYVGLDLSPSLIHKAKRAQTKSQLFLVADVCKPLPLKELFTHAVFILSLQNMSDPAAALYQSATHLIKNGTLVIVLNHPCFRIPRISHWETDEAKKLQYRRVDAYLTPMKIPIQTHPGKGGTSMTTWTYHHPLSNFSHFLNQAGFAIDLIEEWTSDKKSTGKAARMENRARKEFPLFLTIKAFKK